MADRLSAYADWLVANQNKQGTPEFETVANSYKQLRSQGSTAPQAAPDDSLTTGMANSALRMAGGATDFLPTVTKAITGMENPRIVVPPKEDGFMGIDWANIGDTKLVEDKNSTGENLIPGFDGGATFAKAADSIYAKQKALNYQPKVPWDQVKSDPSAANVLGFMGEAAVTSLPDMAAAMFSAPLYFSTYLAPIAQKRAENDGRTQVTPADLAYAAVASAGIATAERIGAKGIFSKGAGNAVTRPLKAGAKEAVTEAIQNPLEYAGETVNTEAGFDPAVAADQSLAGFVGGAGAGTGIRTTLDATGAVANAVSPNDTPKDPEAAADFANRLAGIIEANNFNTNDLEKGATDGARAAVDMAHSQLGADMREKLDFLKQKLGRDRLDPIETVVEKVMADAGANEARTKTKTIVGQQEYDATERLVGQFKEGQDLLRLYRETNELTRLHNSGYVGGLSRITDQLSPFASNVGYTARSAAELPTRLLATGAGATLNPAIPAAQLAAVGTGRAVDALTGRRSRVAKYVRDNQGKGGISIDPDAVSLRQQAIEQDEAQKQREAELRQLNIELDNPPAGMDPDAQQQSPEAVMFKATGLTREGVKEVLAELERTVPQLAPEIASYRKMLTDGTNADGLRELARAVAGEVQRNPGKYSTRAGAYVPGVTPLQGTAGYESPGYQRGILANRTFVDGIKMDVKTDPDLTQDDKDIITSALDNMAGNLGSDPVRTANNILDNAVDQATDKLSAAAYLGPYVDRVREQQDQAQSKRRKTGPNIYRSGVLDTSSDEDIDFQQNLTPILSEPGDVFGIGDDVNTTILPIYPSEGFQPDGPKAKSLNEAVQYLHDRWSKSTGRTEPFEYTPQNIERIANMMAAEAERALREDSNAIGWYDRKLKAAKSVLSLVEPRIFDSPGNEAAFDLALAVTSNGAAVTDNFANAVEVFQIYLDTGKMPADTWKKGGERNESMVKAFEFYNAYQASRLNVPFQEFMDHDFTVRELQDYINQFNKDQGTEIQLSVSENMDTVVKGSFVLGAKIGQGFYQNIRGNYDPLTMDIWWMRMWNRLVGRPFAESKDSDMQKNRDKVSGIVKEAFKDPKSYPVELMLAKQAIKQLGETRRGLYGDPQRMDDFVTMLDSKWQSYFKRYQKDNGKNPVKPQLFKTTGTHTKNIKGKLQATPAGGGEREVMRQTTARAIELLSGIGYNIDTADFQALMWYPEKRLFRSLGVKGGRGEDNDYLDAAIILANKKGISDEQIQEALPDSERGNGIDSGPSSSGQDGSVRSRTGRPDEEIQSQKQLSLDLDGRRADSGLQYQTRPSVGSRPAQPEEVRETQSLAQVMFEIGKPGSQFENGIKDIETVQKLAKALNLAFHLASNKSELARVFGKKSLGKGFTIGAAQGPVDPREKTRSRITGELVAKNIGVLKPYVNKRNPDQTVTPLNSLWTGLHEVGHGIESRFMPGLPEDSQTSRKFAYKRPVDGRQIRANNVYKNTLRSVIAEMMDFAATGKDGRKGYTQQDAQDIIDEIIRFQRTGALTMPDGLSEKVRPSYDEMGAAITRQQAQGRNDLAQENELALINFEENYLQTPHEMAADAIGAYLFDPKMTKQQMPKTAKLLREVLNGGDVFTLYSMPLAALLAAIMANMMVAEGEEEEKQGLLSLGQGALSA